MSSIADLLNPNTAVSREGGGFVVGTVTENADTNFPGMVKVEFTSWTNGKSIHDWMPILHSYAGAEHGIYMVPEIGDIVLVGFTGTGFQKPFILGCFYPAGAAFKSESFNDKNGIRHYKPKGGVDFVTNSEAEKQSVCVKTPKGLTLKIEDEQESLTICDQSGENKFVIDFKGGKMELTAKTSILLKTQGCELNMDGQGGAISIKCDRLELKAAQTVKISGGQTLILEGGVLKAEGKQVATFKSGSVTTISGSIVKIN